MEPLIFVPYMGSEAAKIEINGWLFTAWRHRKVRHSLVRANTNAKYDRRGMDAFELMCHIAWVKQELEPKP